MAMPKRGGWWVKAAANGVTPAAGRPPGLLAQNKSAQVRSHGVGEPIGTKPNSPLSLRTKKSPRADPRATPWEPPRLKTVVPDQIRPTGSLLDRVRGDPNIRTGNLDREAKTHPQSRRNRASVESHPVILRNLQTVSKKNLLGRDIFFEDRPHLMNFCMDRSGKPLHATPRIAACHGGRYTARVRPAMANAASPVYAAGCGPAATRRWLLASTAAPKPSSVRAPNSARSPGWPNTTSSTVSNPEARTTA